MTDDGSDGSSRDHATFTSPIFGNRSLPVAVTLNLALAVNLIECRLSLRDRKRGGATLAPFRLPDTD